MGREITVSTLHKEHLEAVLPATYKQRTNANVHDSTEIRLHCFESGIASESSFKVIYTDGQDQQSTTVRVAKNTNSSLRKYEKPIFPCCFCKSFWILLRRHILTTQKDEQSAKPFLKINQIAQGNFIATFRKQAM